MKRLIPEKLAPEELRSIAETLVEAGKPDLAVLFREEAEARELVVRRLRAAGIAARCLHDLPRIVSLEVKRRKVSVRGVGRAAGVPASVVRHVLDGGSVQALTAERLLVWVASGK